MVVVAGDDGHETPMSCVVTKEKNWSNQTLTETERFANLHLRNYEVQFSPSMNEKLVIVGEQSKFDAELFDQSVNLPKILRFGPKSTVREIKYVISYCLPDCPALDSFRIYIYQNALFDILELVGDNKTIDEFNLHLNAFTKFKINIERVRKEDQTEHQRVCKNDIYVPIQISNLSATHTRNEINKILFVSETTTVRHLIENLQEEILFYGYKHENVILRYRNIKITIADVNKTLEDMGFVFWDCDILTIDMSDEDSSSHLRRRLAVNIAGDDDMETPGPWNSSDCIETQAEDFVRPDKKKLTDILMTSGEEYGPRESPDTETKPETIYVGLINQAMTCYLNSLLQALYMTPEFRNALYNWEYVNGSEKDAANSIPYQLQKLFLNLQTSKKNAVETTSLTKSFGWDSTEAWQQHDIQELCRVMFDALEQKFKNTQQADLINRLYEGKMIDYVKCLECGTEKSREDTFLDIPLPVKPFGSAVAYNSVEQALRAFVQPETLDGVNQYFCEKCNKKCDAHKGLKFTKFPYILTLHLKRFDFDYNTFHRIKLNDKVIFPDILNVNSLIPSSTENEESPSTEEDAGTGIKCDDSSTTDSGHLDECVPCDNGISTSENTIKNNEHDDDEGIYISNCPSTSSIHSQENERNRSNRDDCGFYKYELFSIMIHSGSASGGHYYAYIKDFRTQEWLCFNDQIVSPITYQDIQKTYGGGPNRAFYSGAYSTSTNAYMLMYRQINYERNCSPMRVDEFPKHIQTLLKLMKDQEEKKSHERTRQMYKIRVYYHDPMEKMLCSARIFSIHEELLSDTVEKVCSAFHLDNVVSSDQCRLVSYDATCDVIECSYDGRENETIGSIIQASSIYQSNHLKAPDMLLDIRRKDEKFKVYNPGEISTTVFVADVSAKKIIDGPYIVRVPRTMLVTDYKKTLSEWIHFYPQQIRLGENIVRDTRKVDTLEGQLQNEGFYNGCKVFVETRFEADITKLFRDTTPKSMVNLYGNMVMMHVHLPDTSERYMKNYNIPAWGSWLTEKESDKLRGITKLSNRDSKIEKNDVESTAQKTHDDDAIGENEEWQEQSNSEDSSLSDSDRTLVGDASEDDDFVGSAANVDQELYSPTASDNKYNDESLSEDFLRVGEQYGDPVERIKIYVHKNIGWNSLKKNLEPILKVPIKYFKISRRLAENNDRNGSDIKTPTGNFSDGETLTIKLCRAIRDGDFTMKLYLLRLKHTFAINHEWLCEFMVFKSSTVAQIKRELIVELKKNHNIDIPYERLRLSKKHTEVPGTILLDNMTIENFMKIDKDLDDLSSGEFFVQELPVKETVTDPNQIVLFAWRYYPATDSWNDELQEIVLDTRSVTEVKTKLSELSGIPVDRVTFTRGRWPVDSQYDLQRRQEYLNHWVSQSDDEWSPLFEIVRIIFYRDIIEEKEDNPMNVLKVEFYPECVPKHRGSRARLHDPSWSPRRERALKIFVDDK